MDINDMYEALKSGASSEDVLKKLLKDLRAVEEQVKLEKEAEAEQKARAKEEAAKKEALLGEGRAYLINSLLAYSEAYGEPIDEAEIPALEQELKQMERFLEKLITMKRGGDLDPGILIEFFGL